MLIRDEADWLVTMCGHGSLVRACGYGCFEPVQRRIKDALQSTSPVRVVDVKDRLALHENYNIKETVSTIDKLRQLGNDEAYMRATIKRGQRALNYMVLNNKKDVDGVLADEWDNPRYNTPCNNAYCTICHPPKEKVSTIYYQPLPLSTELWAEVYKSLIKDGVKFPENWKGIGACYGGLVAIKSVLGRRLAVDSELESLSKPSSKDFAPDSKLDKVADILVDMNKAFNSEEYCEGINKYNVRSVYKIWAKKILRAVYVF